jgi:hypothetical protein
VSPKTGLDAVANRKSSCLCRESNSSRTARVLVIKLTELPRLLLQLCCTVKCTRSTVRTVCVCVRVRACVRACVVPVGAEINTECSSNKWLTSIKSNCCWQSSV